MEEGREAERGMTYDGCCGIKGSFVHPSMVEAWLTAAPGEPGLAADVRDVVCSVTADGHASLQKSVVTSPLRVRLIEVIVPTPCNK